MRTRRSRCEHGAQGNRGGYPHRHQVPLPRMRIRGKLLSQGCQGTYPNGRKGGLHHARAQGRGRGERTAEDRALPQTGTLLRQRAERQDRGRMGTRLQARDRRHARSHLPGHHTPAARGRMPGARVRPRSDGRMQPPHRQRRGIRRRHV